MKACLSIIATAVFQLTSSLAAQTVDIPATFAWPRSAADSKAPGFKVRVVQANSDQVGFVRLEASSARAEAQLAGVLSDPSTRQPYADVADKSKFNPDGTYDEPGVIDYEQAGNATASIPGISVDGANDDFSFEAITYLDLDPGTYTMIVNSDDGFRVTAGRDPREWFGRLLVGESEGPRGAADTSFSFSISQAGLYGFRLLYYEAGGGANVSWFYSDSRVLLNDPSGGTPKAYRALTEARPTYVRYLAPMPGATEVSSSSSIQVLIGDGDKVQVNPDSIQLFVNDAKVTPNVEKSGSITKVTFTPPGLLPPLATVKVRLVYLDNASPAATRTEQYSFKTSQTVNITLPSPIFFENFDSTSEGSLPTGWTDVSYTDESGSSAEVDFGNLDSAAYSHWAVVNVDRFKGSFVTYSNPNNPASWANDYKRVLSFNPANIVNGLVVTNLASGRFIFADSGYRNGASQVMYLFSPDFNLSGKSDLFLSFHSLWEQNQDSIAAVEYSINGGQTWLPIVYMLETADVVKDSKGAVDAVATFTAENADVAKYTDPKTGEEVGGTYGAFIGATITQDLAPFISARAQDDPVNSKRVEVFPIEKAANQSKVRFRFVHAGTDSWYFGVDDFGIYSISSSSASIKVSVEGGKLVMTWPGAANVVLQKSTTLSNPNWQDVAGTTGASSVTETITGTTAFYRLLRR